jgi:tRNA 2-thiouridine synthesizing protein A
VGWRGRKERSVEPSAAVQADDGPTEVNLVIDALGRKCPIPIIMAAEQIRDIPVGGLLALLADDPAAYTDVPSWCRMKSHELVDRSDHTTGWAFLIRRSY